MRILIVSDAWHPQTNGVVYTLQYLRQYLQSFGHEVLLETPSDKFSLPLIGYKEIRLSLFRPKNLFKKLDAYNIDALYIATEGPLGWAVRQWAHKRNIQYVTAFYTLFPEYIKKRLPFIPRSWLWKFESVFHHKARKTFVPSQSIAHLLKSNGFKNVITCPCGVNSSLFKPAAKKLSLPSPVWLYVGRMAIEKNIESFLKLNLAGTKLLVGDGPLLTKLKKKYPNAVFVGKAMGEELVQYYNEADIFVFPSKTDTFGMVILEALACEKPVAAYNTAGPCDILTSPQIGYLSDDLKESCLKLLDKPTSHCREFALNYDWAKVIKTLESHLIDIHGNKVISS